MKKVKGFIIVTAQVILGVAGLMLALVSFVAMLTLAFHLFLNLLIAVQNMVTSPAQRMESVKYLVIVMALYGTYSAVTKIVKRFRA